MATWMTHFRIADCYISELSQYGVNISKFVFANIAPGCGVLNEDCLTYTPDKIISHFGNNGSRDYELFVKKYLSDKTDMGKFSFYLGYYMHLLCDDAWFFEIYRPKKEKFIRSANKEAEAVWAFKSDCYDLDRLFLKRNPLFRAFRVFAGIECFPNIYFDFFPANVFDIQLSRIQDFYYAPVYGLEREYNCLTETELNGFVDRTAEKLRMKIFDVL